MSDIADILPSRGTRADRTPPQAGKPCQWLGRRPGARLLSRRQPVVCPQYQRLPPDVRNDARYDDDAETRSWLRLRLRRFDKQAIRERGQRRKVGDVSVELDARGLWREREQSVVG